jgi:hypothetical protein
MDSSGKGPGIFLDDGTTNPAFKLLFETNAAVAVVADQLDPNTDIIYEAAPLAEVRQCIHDPSNASMCASGSGVVTCYGGTCSVTAVTTLALRGGYVGVGVGTGIFTGKKGTSPLVPANTHGMIGAVGMTADHLVWAGTDDVFYAVANDRPNENPAVLGSAATQPNHLATSSNVIVYSALDGSVYTLAVEP